MKAPDKKASTAAARRCSSCKKVFSTKYLKQRHLAKKRGCSKRAVAQRALDKKEKKRKSQNKTYYLRRKWGISLGKDPGLRDEDRVRTQRATSKIGCKMKRFDERPSTKTIVLANGGLSTSIDLFTTITRLPKTSHFTQGIGVATWQDWHLKS
ncbi:hypothetical protein PR003_g236 [Phytophthora rubi]|uniref:Uncharacterized protein n=1 Tax=Phytophthora rubi TaxID=129364 RepID=A0A6A4G7B8_9STRA|nr:hypothetical protein PR003_g236 [Phytophthora rubi]